jgi:hypothetical protein
MPTRKPNEPSPLVAAAKAFDDALDRFAALTEALRKRPLESRHALERASERLHEIATCEEELQRSAAQGLMAALGAARDTQQRQAELVRVRALEIKERGDAYAAFLARFEAMGRDATGLNTLARALLGQRRIADQTLRDGDLPGLLPQLDELQERMTAVATTGDRLASDTRAAGFEELSRETESLRQQLLAARNKVGLLKQTVGKAVPESLIS